MSLPAEILVNQTNDEGQLVPWTIQSVHEAVGESGNDQSQRATERQLEKDEFFPPILEDEQIQNEVGIKAKQLVLESMAGKARKKRWQVLYVQYHQHGDHKLLVANDARKGRRWLFVDGSHDVIDLLKALASDRDCLVIPHGELVAETRRFVLDINQHDVELTSGETLRIGMFVHQPAELRFNTGESSIAEYSDDLSHLDRLEADSIHIIREVMAQADNPVMLYSVGKDSSVMLHLARKAFYPSPPPFPLMHVDTRWKFQEMYRFRDQMARESGMEMIVHVNPEGIEKNINPFDHGSALHTDIMKTVGLKQALDKHQFDVAFGGARRDEEKSRAKERVFSFRTNTHRWDPKNQRPELWNLYNGYKNKGESIRVFPLSNWTELDIWQYIYREQIPIVPLYYSAERPVVERDGMLMMVDDDRMRLFPDEEIELRRVRFRTLGCYPLTGAVESDATDLSAIVLELLQSRTSERQGRAIDSDSAGSMEKKKQEGYF